MINLAGNEHLLNAILEYCADIITVKDLNLNYVAFNRAFLKHIGATNITEIIGKSIYEIIPQECCKIIVDNVKRVISELKPHTYTFVLERNGVARIVKQTATPIIRDGELKNILMVSSDVTNEENLKAKLIDKNYQFNTLIENLPFIVYMKDTDRNLIVATQKSRDFIYKGIDNFSTKDIQLNMIDAEAETANEDNYVLQNKKHLEKEKSVIDLNGKTHWYKVHKAPILTETNDITGLVTIAKNIDAEKRLEMQKNLFLATLSHDLKNPLQAQISSLEMLYKQLAGKVNDEQKEILELIIESSKYMRSMLCTLMKTCKESNGAIQLSRTNFDIKKLILHSVKEIRELAANKNIKIVINADADKYIIFADEIQMRRVIGNMLNNAVNYAFENTQINVNLEFKNNNFHLSFENKSDIIPDDLHRHIFDKYVCGEKLQNNAQIGLGLYFCRKVIEAHEGQIELYTNGNTNKFEITMPCINEDSALISEIVL